jgi:hypothetical protein
MGNRSSVAPGNEGGVAARPDIAASENEGRKLTEIAVVVPLCENLKRTTRRPRRTLTLAG